jgi:hypothetical protein
LTSDGDFIRHIECVQKPDVLLARTTVEEATTKRRST